MTKGMFYQNKLGCHDSYVSRETYLSWHTFVKTKPLPWQAYFCRDKVMFVMTHIRHDKHTFVVTKYLLQQLCLSRHIFVMTNTLLLWQNICCDIMFVVTKYFLQQSYVSHIWTGAFFSWQKTCVCREIAHNVLSSQICPYSQKESWMAVLLSY